MVKPIGYVYT